MVTVSLFAAGALGLLLSRRLTGDFFSPPALVLATWSIGLGLCLLYLIAYEPLQPATLQYIAWIVAVLVVSTAAGSAWRWGAPAGPASLPSSTWVTVYSILGLAGVLWYVREVVRVLGWGGFADGERLRMALFKYEIPSTFLVLQFFCLAAPLLAAALRLAGSPLGWRLAILPASCALATLATTDRTQFFSLLLGIFFMYCLRLGPRLSGARLLLAGTLVPLLLAVNFVAVDAWRRSILEVFAVRLRIEAADSRSTPLRAAVWRRATSVYFYFTGSFPALELLLRKPEPPTGGAYSLYPIARLLQRAHLIDSGPPPYIPPFIWVTRPGVDPPVASNAYTFAYYPLRDFGRAGSLGYAGVIGLVSGVAYAAARRRRDSALALVVAGQVSVGVALLWFVNKFNNTASWYVLALTVVPFAVARARAALRPVTPDGTRSPATPGT
jgi:hypothetical protein